MMMIHEKGSKFIGCGILGSLLVEML